VRPRGECNFLRTSLDTEHIESAELKKLSLWLHTLRYLKPVQVSTRFTRTWPRAPRFPKPAVRARSGVWKVSAPPPRPLDGTSRLAEYTRHYHGSPTAERIANWIAENPVGQGAGWEPYPLSLRIVNWIKWLLDGGKATAQAAESLAAQADYLSRRVEYHLLGNHVFANAKALVFAGTFFSEDRWLRKGLRILAREVAEQILADGGHFERSPMYHCLVLEDVLDLTNLGRAYPGLLPDWSEPAGRMLGWLRLMLHQDGRISFFNDSTFGVAPEPTELFSYAKRLGVAPATVPLSESGYVRLEGGGTVVLFDAGEIGPDYQPGHAHADTLSFEVSHQGRRLLVNTGISTYEAGTERQRQRGTAAHNTVRVDGIDQSELWKSFRVGRRARPLDLKTDGRTWVEAAHDGYCRLKEPVIHRRRLELKTDRLVIIDRLEGEGRHLVECYYHLHPGRRADVRLDSRLTRSVEHTTFHPGFDRSVPNETIVGRWSGECPVTFMTEVLLPD